MSNVIAFHPPKSPLILLYEVVGEDGHALWGGEKASEAINWLRHGSYNQEVRLLVSAWDSDEEDAHLIGQTIDITKITLAAFREGQKV